MSSLFYAFDINNLKVSKILSYYIDFRTTFVVNPLFHEFSLTSVFKIQPKIGSFRLPTHSRDAHRKFFW